MTWTPGHATAILALAVSLWAGGRATAAAPVVAGTQAAAGHAAWTALLAQYVDDEGRVAYQRLAREAGDALEHYLTQLADAQPDSIPPKARLAFWINAYNAGTVAAVLQGYAPGTALGRARMFRWYSFKVAGRNRTLDEIENEILRPRFSEPRIHFALVCGATSCPKLRREAYEGGRLDAQLDDQARGFINDPRRNRIDPAHDRVELSMIFRWFADDFASRGGPAGVVSAYAGTPAQVKLLRRRKDRLQFMEYDWTLNAQGGQRPAPQ